MKGKRIYSNVSKESVESNEYYVGIDVHKKHWVVTIRTFNLEIATFTIYRPTAEKLEKHLKEKYKDGKFHLVYEAGFSGYSLYDYFHERGIDIVVVAPNRLYHDGSKVKTDIVDSRKLAHFLSRGMIKPVEVPSAKMREYRSVIQIYERTKDYKKSIQNRIKSLLDFMGRHSLSSERWSKSYIKKLRKVKFKTEELQETFLMLLDRLEFYNSQIIKLREKIYQMGNDEEIRDKVERLVKIRGFGKETAIQLIVYLFAEPDRFRSGEALVHYLGLTPSEHSSGAKRRRGKTGYNGNPHLRKLIIQLSWRVVRIDPVLIEKFENIVSRTGLKSKAIVAIARKFMVRIYTILKKGVDYEIGLIR